MPVTRPDAEPIVAIEPLLLLQLPPDVRSFNVTVAPGQRPLEPVIGAGNGLMVTTAVFLQPVAVSVNVIGAVPADDPVTKPVDKPIDATVVFPLTHVPAPDASVNVMVEPAHTGVLLPGTAGRGETMTDVVAGLPHWEV